MCNSINQVYLVYLARQVSLSLGLVVHISSFSPVGSGSKQWSMNQADPTKESLADPWALHLKSFLSKCFEGCSGYPHEHFLWYYNSDTIAGMNYNDGMEKYD